MNCRSYELLLHRPIFGKGPCPISGAVSDHDGRPFANPPTLSRQPPAPIVSHAARMITQHGQQVYAICNRDVRFLPLNYVSFLFAALSVQLVELKNIDSEKERMVMDDVNFNLFFLGSLAEMYPIAGWCRKLLVKILNETGVAENVAQPQDVSDKCKGPGNADSQLQDGLERIAIDEGHQRDMPSPTTNFSSEIQYPQQRQDTDVHHPPETTCESVPMGSESTYRNAQNAHPHHNPHHLYHSMNFYQLSASPGNGSGGSGYSHVRGSLGGIANETLQPPVVPAFNCFDLPSLQTHSNRIRSRDTRYSDPCSSRGPTPMAISAIAMPTIPIHAPSSVQSQERGKQHLPEKWASDMSLDTSLLHVTAGAVDLSQHQRETDRLRYHVVQGPGDHGFRLVEEAFDDDDDDDDDEDGLHGEDDRRSVLQAAAAAAAAVSGRQRSSVATGSGENVNSRREGADVPVTESDQGRPRLHHTHSHSGAPVSCDNQWVFDGAGVLLGNPFLIGSNTDAYGNPVGETVSPATVAHGVDPQPVPVSQGAYHHSIPYHTQHGHHHG